MPVDIPDVVIDRLPVYARALKLLEREGREVVISHELGTQLGVTPAQIRKDLSYFGRFGKQGRGYNVQRLLSELRQILGLDQQWTLALVGVGNLGRAIVTYGGFAPEGFYIVEAFDASPEIVGQRVGQLVVRNVKEVSKVLRRKPVDIGIVAVPASAAQGVIDTLVSCGVKALLNYAPMAARVPGDIRMRHIDPVLALQSMTFYLKGQKAGGR
jgi:redox-sensing transcriptional repressor